MKEDNKKVVKKGKTKSTASKKTGLSTKTPTKKVIKKPVVLEEEKIVVVKKSENSFSNNLLPILIFSLLTSFIAIFVAYYTTSKENIFTFSGFNSYISVDSGLIATTQKVNGFEGNNIQYIYKDDIIVTKYEIGYYLKNNNFSTPIIKFEGKSEQGISLKKVIDSIVGLDFTEPANVENYLTKESIELLKENKLYFIIKYETEHDNETIPNNIELKLNVLYLGNKK